MWHRQAKTSGTDGLSRDVVVLPAGASRYGDVYELDLRFEKVISITATSTVTLSADLFNVTNQNTILQRQNRIFAREDGAVDPNSSTNSILEIQSPRVWRFGARITF